MRLQRTSSWEIVPSMESQRILLCIAVFAAAGCESSSGIASDALKGRLLDRERYSLHQQAMARIQASQREGPAGFFEVPLPEPNLDSPVSELIPWKD
jgi:hypothetical protein